ncbi:hypothetical protein C9Z70_22975 [Escherichia coli]|nr:hypothetical protein ECSTECMHI813_3269 [Escherichia coli STEC_MHI813]TJP94721.1 hypothetical protein C9Z76_25355 [Escherichia coli]TJP96192.1 hypothetical protein C9Z70_22975 [Escherichia coli]TJQ44258.1 hypothetical protein C9Z62_19775 [Escherichia coli]
MFPGFTVMLENLHKAVSGKLHNNSQQSSDKRNSNPKTMQEDYTAFTSGPNAGEPILCKRKLTAVCSH